MYFAVGLSAGFGLTMTPISLAYNYKDDDCYGQAGIYIYNITDSLNSGPLEL